MSILRTEHVSKRFGEHEVLKDINLTVESGEVIVLIGPSGAGKSTYLRSLNQLEKITSGKIFIHDKLFLHREGDRTIHSADKKTHKALMLEMGMVFQRFNLFPHKTVLENVMIAPRTVKGIKKEEAVPMAMELLNRVGLSDKADAYPARLSGGQQQRVAIARALATNPKILLCDEATSALDPQTTQSILSLIRELKEKLGLTVVVITHQMSVVEQICTRVAILDQGRVVEEGPVSEVFAAPKTRAAKALVYPEGFEQSPLYRPAGSGVLRVVFRGMEATKNPLLAQMAMDKGIPASILSASTRLIGEKTYGSMILGIPGGEQELQTALAYLGAIPDIDVEEVRENAQ